ncbi:MAG: Ig-like domain-containing protein [Terriglobales bacterium]
MRLWLATRVLPIALTALALAGCGGSSNTNKTVVQVTLSPASLSVVAGEVVAVAAGALNASGTAVAPAPNFTINTSNPKLVTVSPKGDVCGGVWDSTFVVCNGLDSVGNPLAGIATLTATANGVTSAPVTVSVHPVVTSVVVDPVTGCTSTKLTKQFTPHACSTAVTPHDAGPPCGPGAAEISGKIGDFTWSSTNSSVVNVDPNGLATASAPGLAGIVASVGTTTSPATNFKTCMPTQIVLHVNGDVGTPTEQATMALTETRLIQADMVDENGVLTLGAPMPIFSNNQEVVLVTGPSSGATITAESPGGAGLLAVCVPPACGAGINQPVYSNLFSVFVTGAGPATAVYVGSSSSTSLIPFDTSKNPPVAGPTVTLPGGLFSMVFIQNGSTAYLGTTQGLVKLDSTTNGVTTLTTNATGSILAISPDGNRLIMSNAAFEPDPTHHRLFVYDVTANTVTTFILPGANAAAFTNDGAKAYITAGSNPQNVYVFSPFLTLQKLSVGGNAFSSATTASGPFAFLADSLGLKVVNVCDNSLAANAPSTSTPQLVGAFQDNDTFVSVNSTGLDVDSLTVGLPASGFCPPTVTHSNQFLDFGLGAFTARKLLVSTSIFNPIVVLPVGINKVISTVVNRSGPTAIPFAGGGTEALSGGITLDGSTLWVGVAGTNNLHRINLLTNTDEVQVALTDLKKADGSQAPPEVVAVKPK